MSGRDKKLVVVGDAAVGKTSLLMTFQGKTFPKEHVPTVFENYSVEQVVDGKNFGVTLLDTAGQEEYDRIRALSYPNTDAFVLCFAVTDAESFANLSKRWIPELQKFYDDPNVVLAGLKSDLRDDPEVISGLAQSGQKAVTVKQAEAYAKTIKAFSYVECSALKGNNVQQVFEEAIRSTMSIKRQKSKGCCTLL